MDDEAELATRVGPADAGRGLEGLGLPQIDQVGFVVRSIDDARVRYGPLFGPFRELDGSVREAEYRGRIADVDLAILFGRSGDVEMEFIEWRGGESPHREFIEQGREGMHHIRYRVSDVDGWIEKVKPVGYAPHLVQGVLSRHDLRLPRAGERSVADRVPADARSGTGLELTRRSRSGGRCLVPLEAECEVDRLARDVPRGERPR